MGTLYCELSLRTSFIESHKLSVGMLCIYFHFILGCFNFYFCVDLFLFSRRLFSSHEFLGILLYLLFKFRFSSWWSDRMQGIISISLYLLRLSLCPSMWSVIEEFMCDAKNNIHFSVFVQSVLPISVRFTFGL